MFYLIAILILLGLFLFLRCTKKRRKNETLENDDWWQKMQEREERERKHRYKMDARFTSYLYPGKVPFDFDKDCYAYVESYYDERVNHILETHLDEIERIFQSYGFRFMYIPRWSPDRSLLPWTTLNANSIKNVESFLDQKTTADYTELLCLALRIDKGKMKNGLFHFACYLLDDIITNPEIVKSKFTVYSLDELNENNVAEFFKEYCDFIVWGRKRPTGCYMSVVHKPSLTEAELYEQEGFPQTDIADYQFPKEMKDIADDIKKKIERLKDAGYYELLLHTLGSEIVNDLKEAATKPSLSRLQITDDFKILLCDYNREVHLTPLQKTLYIFYLRHPEGVEFKYLSVYYDELLAICKVLSNRENDEKQRASIHRLVDTLDNAINEKCSRIKEAFLKVTDDFVARNYYITLNEQSDKYRDCYYYKRLKRITLPRHLVTYPQEIEDIAILHPDEEKNRLHSQRWEETDAFRDLKQKFFKKTVSKRKLIERFTEYTRAPKLYHEAYFYRAILYTHIGMYEKSIADSQYLIDHNVRVWANALINRLRLFIS